MVAHGPSACSQQYCILRWMFICMTAGTMPATLIPRQAFLYAFRPCKRAIPKWSLAFQSEKACMAEEQMRSAAQATQAAQAFDPATSRQVQAGPSSAAQVEQASPGSAQQTRKVSVQETGGATACGGNRPASLSSQASQADRSSGVFAGVRFCALCADKVQADKVQAAGCSPS